MTREEASKILDDYDVNFDGHTAEEIAEAFDVAFRALEQEPCEDAVSRKAVFEAVDDCNSSGLTGIFCSYDDGERFKEYIKDLPPVTPQPKPGHWIEHEKSISTGFKHYRECSCCKCYFDWLMPRNSYCPNCGTHMISEG